MLYTEGLTEVRNPEGEQFGEERLSHALATGHRIRPQEIIEALIRAVHAFTGARGVDDDQAALVLTATAPGHPPVA